MSTKREFKQPTPSIIARLMGLDEPPRQQPVQKKPRVLSEDYLYRVVSIGVREKLYDSYSFRPILEDQDECKNVFQVLESLRRNKRQLSGNKKLDETNDVSLQAGQVAEFGGITVCKKSRKCEQKYVDPLKKVQNGYGIYVDDTNKSRKSNLKVDNRSFLTSSTSVLKPNLREAGNIDSGNEKKNDILITRKRNMRVEVKGSQNIPNGVQTGMRRSRFLRERTKDVGHSTSTISCMKPCSEISVNKPFEKESRPSIRSSPVLSYRNSQVYNSDGSYVARAAKKQISERWKTAKKFQLAERASSCKTRGEDGSGIGGVNFCNSLGLSSLGGGENECFRNISKYRSLLPYFNADANPDTRSSYEACTNGEQLRDQESINRLKEKPGEKDSILLAEEKDSPDMQDVSVQEICREIFEEDSISSPYSGTDPESPMSAEEAYRLSPNSVLEPSYKKEITYISDCFKSVKTSLHGLQLQLELLESEAFETYSEISSIMVSSDEDSEEGSVNDSDEKQNLMHLVKVEESRDFSYMVDVLAEAGFCNTNTQTDYDMWHSRELISYCVFESMEKKYGGQISWKRSERKLLFDRINSGLVEILQPSTGLLASTKPLSRRLCFSQGDEMIEEKLWKFLVNQVNESEKFFGRDDKWMKLDEDIQIIGREIENSLIDELFFG
ncbi:uncharacterized protein LOC126662031 [Mercurialis annua]|uniref:uncharacterized protein LOC126662031 n=1 Tax=Mercurialis annua TaxID=3986 RepID=UPI0024AF8FF1|nr:uncharacterized protein LOC126662031 [Mercurialis annua]